jgi:hypothetical protein
VWAAEPSPCSGSSQGRIVEIACVGTERLVGPLTSGYFPSFREASRAGRRPSERLPTRSSPPRPAVPPPLPRFTRPLLAPCAAPSAFPPPSSPRPRFPKLPPCLREQRPVLRLSLRDLARAPVRQCLREPRDDPRLDARSIGPLRRQPVEHLVRSRLRFVDRLLGVVHAPVGLRGARRCALGFGAVVRGR